MHIGGVLYSLMKQILLLFACVVHLYAAVCDGPFLRACDEKGMYTLCHQLKTNGIVTLEVKFIQKDPGCDHGSAVFGSVFFLNEGAFWRNRRFWEDFCQVMLESKEHGVSCNREFQRKLLNVLRSCERRSIAGLEQLSPQQIDNLFPSDTAVRWGVGLVDWILKDRVPGSVTLCPGGVDYALHFVPEQIYEKKDCNCLNLQGKVQELQQSMTKLEERLRTVEAILQGVIDHLKSLCVSPSSQAFTQSDPLRAEANSE